MSQLPQTGPTTRRARSIGFDFGVSQPTRLDVVPMATTGPDYSASRQLVGLEQSFGGALSEAGQVAASVNQQREHNAMLNERDLAISAGAAAKMAEDQARSERNAAALRSAELAPQIAAKINSGELAPLPNQSLEDFAHAVVAQYAGTESPAYAEEMTKLLVPRVIGQQVEMAQQGQAIAQKAEDDGTVARALFASNPAEAQAIIDDAAFATGNTPARVQAIQVRTMLAAAEGGNKALVSAMQERLGNAAPEQIVRANLMLAQYDSQAKTKSREDFYNKVDGLVLQQAPLADIAKFIDGSGMEPGDKLRAVKQVRAEYADQIKRAEAAKENADVQEQIDRGARAVVAGGSAYRPIISPMNLPSGRTISIADQEAAYRNSFQKQTGFQYGDMYAGDKQADERTRAYMVAVTDSGVGDPAMQSIAKRLSFASDDLGKATPGDIQAVSMFRKARAFGVAPMLFDTSDKSYAVLDAASRMIDHGGQPNGLALTPEQAIVAAKRQWADGELNKGITGDDIARVFKADPSLTPEQAQRVARTAKNYALTTDPKTAIEDAMKADLVDTAPLLIPSGPQAFWDAVNPLNLNPFDFGGQINSPAFGTRESKRFDLGILATSDEGTKQALGKAAGTILRQRVEEAQKANPSAGITPDSFYLRSVGPGVWQIKEVGPGVALPNNELNRTVLADDLRAIASAYLQRDDDSLPTAASLEAAIAATERQLANPQQLSVGGPGGKPPIVFAQQELATLKRDLKVRQAIDMINNRGKK